MRLIRASSAFLLLKLLSDGSTSEVMIPERMALVQLHLSYARKTLSFERVGLYCYPLFPFKGANDAGTHCA